jgi:hypothetical protein
MAEPVGIGAAWLCAHCGVGLETGKVKLSYLGKDFEHDLPRCPLCREVFIAEALALGKMLEVERALEDK